MVWPTVTELPRNLEPATPDTFVHDLNEQSVPRSQPAAPQPRWGAGMSRTRLADT